MSGLISICVLGQMLLAGAGRDAGEFINIERLSQRVVLGTWVGVDRRCNLTAIQTQKGLVIIDTEMSPRVMAPIKEKMEKAFGRNDWAYVINTHAHDNHPGGNSLFQGAVTVGHENLWQEMQWHIQRQTEPDWKRRELDRAAQLMQNLRTLLPQVARNRLQARVVGGEIRFWELHTQDLQEGYELVKPTLTFADRHTLDMGDVKLELVWFGKGHSLSDTLIYVPQEKLLVTGAIVYQRAHLPEIAEETELKDIHRFLAVLDGFLADGVEIKYVVPSHSSVLLRSDLLPVRDYYQRMLTGMQAARKEGLTLEQTAARLDLRTKFPALRDAPPGVWSHGFHERNLNNLWRILDQEEQKLKMGPEKKETLTPSSLAEHQ
jgi:glyoxylase-like metal-dependent hydrolase (beta-lactamase superfamily II)